MIDIQYNLWGPIVAIQKVDTTFVKQVKEEGRKTYFKWNSNLAGEIEKEYFEISKKRIAHTSKQLTLRELK